jgi:hypothetical protein
MLIALYVLCFIPVESEKTLKRGRQRLECRLQPVSLSFGMPGQPEGWTPTWATGEGGEDFGACMHGLFSYCYGCYRILRELLQERWSLVGRLSGISQGVGASTRGGGPGLAIAVVWF